MRVRARVAKTVAALAGALAMAASLSGCVTVHGENAVVPAASKAEARRALERYVKVSNEAYASYDSGLNETIEKGPLGAIDNAALYAQHQLSPEGDEDYEPLEVSDTRYHIPQQAGWPKFFVVDTATNRSEDRWLMVFTRDSIDEKWKATYLAVLPADEIPEFATDGDGYLQDIPAGGGSGLAIAPDELSASYAGTLTGDGGMAGDGYLQTGEGPFADGPYTSELLAERDASNSSPEYEMQYRDWAAEEAENAPVAIRTADGGALVLFASHHSDKQTVVPGRSPSVDPLVEELMEGTAETSVTRTWVAMQAALVPEGEGDTVILDRRSGVVSAIGE